MSTIHTPAPSQQQPASPLFANRHPTSPSTNSPLSPALDAKSSARAKVRLPPTIEPQLAPHAYSTRHSFSQAIAADQRAALEPDYQTSFDSANDVVNRLLPYHVWHVNEDDLRWTMDRDSDGSGKGEGSSNGPGNKRKREAREADADRNFPSSEEAFRLFARYSKLQSRARRLRQELTGGTSASEGAPFSKESLYNIEKLAVEQERELLAAEQDRLRQAKEKAIEAGVGWEALMRLGPTFGQTGQANVGSGGATATGAGTGAASGGAGAANGFSPIAFQKSVGSLQAGAVAVTGANRQHIAIASSHSSPTSSAPGTSLPGSGKGSKPRGRPRKSRDESGKIIATPAAVKPAVESKSTASLTPTPSTPFKSTAPAVQSQQPSTPAPVTTGTSLNPASRLPSLSTPRPTSVQPSGSPPASAIPTHPIPLVLPLSTLAQLSSLGIAPIPAPHLLPAISAQQQAQMQRQGQTNGPVTSTPPISLSQSIHSTAPRPAPANQEEPALLMGITEAPLLRKPTAVSQGKGGGASTQQMLHVSVVLSKLSPSQLSGLAALMQSLQGGGGGGDKASASGKSNGGTGTENGEDKSKGPSPAPASSSSSSVPNATMKSK